MGQIFLNRRLLYCLLLILKLFTVSETAISLPNEENVTITQELRVPSNLKIISLTPSQLQLSTITQIEIIIDSMPKIETDFFCVFSSGDHFFETKAVRTDNGVNCLSPKAFPKIKNEDNFVNWKLSVRMADLVSTNFTVFDCNTYQICSECIFSGFPCEWLREDIKCGYCSKNSNGKCITDQSNNKVLTAESGLEMCPSIIIDDPIILVPSGIKKAVKVNVLMIEGFLIQANFRCRFDLENQNLEVMARLLADIIYCDQIEFSYKSENPKISVRFFILAGRAGFHLENPKNISIEVYKCGKMAKDCISCLSVEEKYNCGWCEKTNSCEIRNSCDGHWTIQKYDCDYLDSNITRSVL